MGSRNDDDTTRYGLTILAGVVVFAVVGVLALAIGKATRGSLVTPASVAMPPGLSVPTPMESGFAPPEKLDFVVGSDALPADSHDVLAHVAESARAQYGVSVLISSFHDASSNAQANADLAKRRALAVRHALEAYGVSPEHLLMSHPEPVAGGADHKQAHRVELRLR
jgi:outer membrane protein OmpA-like peptidoglycan-associated protein